VPRDSFSSGMRTEEHLKLLTGWLILLSTMSREPLFSSPTVIQAILMNRKVIEKVAETISNSSRLITVVDDLLPEELKRLIDQCDILVSWRFHPSLQAISLSVPVIGITGDGRIKFEETIGKLAGQAEWLILTDGKRTEELLKEIKQKVLLIMQKHYEVRSQMGPIADRINEQTSILAKLIMNRIYG